MIIKYDLLKKSRRLKHNLNIKIDLYKLASELFQELERRYIIEKLKETPQLGVIKFANQNLGKTRYDYIMLQLYIHSIIKEKIQNQLRCTYNCRISPDELYAGKISFVKDERPTVGDILQLLVIVYNIGHFYTTFTASRAVIMAASENKDFAQFIINSSDDERFQMIAKNIIDEKNYYRYHLLNSLLILEKCDQSLKSVSLCKEILYAYLNESDYPSESKLKYIFSIFKKVRTLSFIAYDLQISNVPLSIDLCNEKAMIILLKELLSEYNNNRSLIDLEQSISKLLGDTVYNENSNAICYYKISRAMVSLMVNNNDYSNLNYYEDLFLNKESILNSKYKQKKDFDQSQILKITFSKAEKASSDSFLSDIERMNHTRVGYYDRYNGDRTILVSLKNNCDSNTKTFTALRILKKALGALRTKEYDPYDSRFILCTKFFLYYLFNENPLVIKQTINPTKCVLCTRGSKARINGIQKLLDTSIGNEDENHEVVFLLSVLEGDDKNDITISVPGSILIYQNGTGRKLAELDGIIIHPMRREHQVIFLEAKNTSEKPGFAQKCLIKKFDDLNVSYNKEEFVTIHHDAKYEYSVVKK